jgi:hypothetical protein
MMVGKLNIFQKTMLQWNNLHPYNAVHVVRVSRPLDLPRLTRTINEELERLDLTGLSIDKAQGTFQYRGGPGDYSLRMLSGVDDPQSLLRSEMETEVNTPFADDGPVRPFRFFVIGEESGFYLGLTYFHVIAGAESIILLLRHFVSKYLDQEFTGFSAPLEIYPMRYGRLLPRKATFLIRKFSSIPVQISDLRRSSKPGRYDVGNQSNGLIVFSLTSRELQTLLRSAKGWGITLNDLFLGLLLKCLSPFASRRFTAPRRTQISVGSIVNIRKDLGINSLKTFGLFLGSFIVSHPVPEEIPLDVLAREVHEQTLEIKRSKLYLGTPMDLWLSRILLSFHSPEGRLRFYTKRYPLWGGITNMNLNPLWPMGEKEGAIDYFRAVSTGPITPLALSITTVRDVVNIGLTYKKAVFTPAGVKTLISDFREYIHRIEVGA